MILQTQSESVSNKEQHEQKRIARGIVYLWMGLDD